MFDELWKLADEPGAISTAALLLDARRLPVAAGPVELDERQSAAFRLARSRLANGAKRRTPRG